MFRFVKSTVKAMPGFTALENYLRVRYAGHYLEPGYPRGHVYSPLPDIDEVRSNADFFNRDVDLGSSINLRKDEQQALLGELQKFFDEFP